MAREIAHQLEREVSRPLKVLVPLIKQEIDLGDDAGLEHYRRAGEMLLEAKAQIEHGQWQAWVRRNFTLSMDTAKNYMKLARVTSEKGSAIPFSKLSHVARPNARSDHRQAWNEPVRAAVAKVNVDTYAQEQLQRERERKLLRDLALQLIDIGFKALATKLHPDRGGSSEAMTRLNRVRQLLRAAV